MRDRVKGSPCSETKSRDKDVWAEMEFRREGLVNSPPCLSFVTDAEAQPLTTCKDKGGGLGGGGGGVEGKHVE